MGPRRCYLAEANDEALQSFFDTLLGMEACLIPDTPREEDLRRMQVFSGKGYPNY